ncbi:MAG TPA: SDR family oxidoreductase [Acidimicrobiia bacterium]|nr:SDR family oxidoreductase [Acidimicrobiia bacterium]
MTTATHPSDIDLTGRVAIVSGASRGIGRALALGLADAGAHVVCSARSTATNPGELPGTVDDVAAQIRDRGGRAISVGCDIGREEDIERLAETTIGELGGVDVLVNNAMTPTRGHFSETTPAMWDSSMRVNVRSLFLTARAVTPLMRQRGGGSIINISSGAADPNVTGMPPGYVTYCVAKAALERFSTALAGELAEWNIAVNALRPGAVKTEMTVHELGEDFDWTGWAEPEAVVPSVNYLADQRGTGFTGHIVDSTQFGSVWPTTNNQSDDEPVTLA